jgi:hypothetical protein
MQEHIDITFKQNSNKEPFDLSNKINNVQKKAYTILGLEDEHSGEVNFDQNYMVQMTAN